MTTRVIFDIGGTNTRVALAEDGAPTREEKVPTPPEPAAVVELVCAYAEKAGGAGEAVGGVAGRVKNGVVTGGPNLSAWDSYDLAAALKACGITSVTVMNDAAAAGIGEALAGAGKGKRIVAYFTVSTGVGGSLTIDGRTAPHAEGFEPGKQIIDYQGMRSLEDIVSGAALAEAFGKPAKELPRSVYEERTKPLAIGLYDAIRFWSPDILVLGGSLMNEENGYRIGEVAEALRAIAPDLPLPPLVHSQFGDAAGLFGAALCRD